MSVQTNLNRAINFLGEAGYTLVENSAPFVAVGAGAGYASGIGIAKGVLQGLAACVLHAWAVTPINNYILRHAGDGPGKIGKSAQLCCVGFLGGTKAVASGAITYAVADVVLTAVGQYMPEALVSHTSNYDAPKAALVSTITLASPYVIPTISKVGSSVVGLITSRSASSTSDKKSEDKSLSTDEFHDSSSQPDLTAVGQEGAGIVDAKKNKGASFINSIGLGSGNKKKDGKVE